LLEDGLPVNIYKRRGNRSLRLSVNAEGTVRVSIPAWAPYSAGLNFARSRRSWILAQRTPDRGLADGQPIGKAHHLQFMPKAGLAKPSGRVRAGAVVVSHPPELPAGDPAVQAAARKAAVRALRAQAEQLLPQRLAALAKMHDFSYGAISVKQLKSRWGSCDQHGNISLNLFLMQLPWECIDYVLLHELTHTRIMRHGPDFWKAMEALQPDVKVLRKRLRGYQPVLDGSAAADMA
ncbi:MAG TPA: SprT family zinc-dependent metalloprotease, partial [Candidatus Saccharimonadales bacterium]|nr:SprT family zinc-dependent metalloprotease [Candidatus Saccharimonadales bacterium]